MLTLLGASLMFFAVVMVAARQLPQLGTVAEAELTVEGSQSLASFAASEYAERKAGLGFEECLRQKSRFLRLFKPTAKDALNFCWLILRGFVLLSQCGGGTLVSAGATSGNSSQSLWDANCSSVNVAEKDVVGLTLQDADGQLYWWNCF